MDGQKAIQMFDFEKAFNTPPNELLKCELFGYGDDGKTTRRIFFLYVTAQPVLVNGAKSKWAQVLSGVPLGNVPGPLLFS